MSLLHRFFGAIGIRRLFTASRQDSLAKACWKSAGAIPVRTKLRMSSHEMRAVFGLYPLCQILIDQGVLPHDRLLAGLKECVTIRLRWAT
jgi:hypothetical protein